MSEKTVVVALGHKALGTTLPEQKQATKAAAKAIADLVSDEELNEDFIMPEPFDPRVSDVVSQAVKSHIEA